MKTMNRTEIKLEKVMNLKNIMEGKEIDEKFYSLNYDNTKFCKNKIALKNANELENRITELIDQKSAIYGKIRRSIPSHDAKLNEKIRLFRTEIREIRLWLELYRERLFVIQNRWLMAGYFRKKGCFCCKGCRIKRIKVCPDYDYFGTNRYCAGFR